MDQRIDEYLTEQSVAELRDRFVSFGKAEDGTPVVLVKSSRGGLPTPYDHGALLLLPNRNLVTETGEHIYFHIVSPTRKDEESIHSFRVIQEYLFRKLDRPMDGDEIVNLVASLEQFFTIRKVQDLANYRLGMAGELIALTHLRRLGWEAAFAHYHSRATNKHDFELSPTFRMDVKTAWEGEGRIHEFSHSQLVRTDCEVYVLSCLLEESDQGDSLLDLFEEALEECQSLSPDIYYELQKSLVRCGLSPEDPGPRIARRRAEESLKAMNARNLPHLPVEGEIPGVTAIRYRVDCNLGEAEHLPEFVALLNSISE